MTRREFGHGFQWLGLGLAGESRAAAIDAGVIDLIRNNIG